MDELTIGEVARRAGLHTSAIRYYESVGLLPPPKRVNGRRRYDVSVFQRLGLIQLIRGAGFGIGEIQTLFAAFSEDTPVPLVWQAIAAKKEVEMQAVIEQAQATKILLNRVQDCQCEQVGDCVVVTFNEGQGGIQVRLSC
jgi:MerR family redox-sensitive transcriptional activator SoxR